ncbi:hypothetical protein L208DRAFT_454656 [Tricholoma matsutake]|nr:hypothetical protein L208DRAFT_454656 [Tricholoma matsutake 945]
MVPITYTPHMYTTANSGCPKKKKLNPKTQNGICRKHWNLSSCEQSGDGSMMWMFRWMDAYRAGMGTTEDNRCPETGEEISSTKYKSCVFPRRWLVLLTSNNWILLFTT